MRVKISSLSSRKCKREHARRMNHRAGGDTEPGIIQSRNLIHRNELNRIGKCLIEKESVLPGENMTANAELDVLVGDPARSNPDVVDYAVAFDPRDASI